MKTPRSLFAILTFIYLALASHAEIVLTLNTTTKRLWFSGSDTGTLSTFAYWNYTGWSTDALYLPETLTITDAFTFSSGTTYAASLLITSSAIEIDTSAYGVTTSSAIITAAGASVSFDYSSLSAANIAYLESLIGSTIGASSGSGFSAIRVIPEPSTYAFIAGCASLAWVLIRRWRRS